jgi:hypothetical protein
VLNSVLGGGYRYNGYGNTGVNSQAAVNQCANAVQARLGGGYGYNGRLRRRRGRVLGISRVEPRSSGGLTVRDRIQRPLRCVRRAGSGRPDGGAGPIIVGSSLTSGCNRAVDLWPKLRLRAAEYANAPQDTPTRRTL